MGMGTHMLSTMSRMDRGLHPISQGTNKITYQDTCQTRALTYLSTNNGSETGSVVIKHSNAEEYLLKRERIANHIQV